MGQLRITRLFAVASVAVLAVAVASPASQATGSGHGHDYYQPPTRYADSGVYDPGCGDLDVTPHFKVRGIDSLKNVKGSRGQAFLYEDRFKFSEVWKDSHGDVVITWRGKYHFKEVSAKRVWKSQVPDDLIPPGGLIGPIYLFKSFQVGWDIVRDADGKALYRTRGLQVFRNLFDTEGDHAPGGTSLKFDVVKTVGPHPDFDICEVVAGLLD